jgi:hypothetical protein
MQASSGDLWSQWRRLGGIFGILFLILFFVSILGLQGESPAYDDPIEEIRAYFADDRDIYLTGDFLIGIAFVFLFLPFAACVRPILAEAEGEPGICARLFYTGAVVTVVIGFAASIAWGTLAFAAAGDSEVDDGVIRAFMYMDAHAFSGLGFAFGLTALFGSLAIVRTGVFAKWSGYLGILAAALSVIGAAWIIDGDDEGILALLGLLGNILFTIWILALSIMLLRQAEAPVAATA